MSVSLSVLLVDDDKNILKTLALSLKDLDCEVTEVSSVAAALERLSHREFDLILSDFRMVGQTGIDLIRSGKASRPDALFVIMTAFASYENAVAVVKEGAFDYLPKPFTNQQLSHLLCKVRTVSALRRENRELKGSRTRRDYFQGLTSPSQARLEEFVRKVAPTGGTVLLVGESGTGKSELAKLIHELSPRAREPFVTVNCTSLAESLLESELFGHAKGAFSGAIQDKRGRLEIADGGTLFLDEIGDLSLPGQSKLLRFLQDRVFERVGDTREISVDTRVIAATNKDLEESVREGKFRDDLYYRLNMLECKLVPLRFRLEDLGVLTQRVCREIEARLGLEKRELPEAVVRALEGHSWPGNIRELRNVLERLYLLSGDRAPQLTDLPDSVTARREAPKTPQGEALLTLEQVERSHIEAVLAREPNYEKAAEILGITTVTLWRKRKEYGLR